MESKFVAEQKFKKKIKHTKLCEKEKNLRKKREKQKFESIFFPKKITNAKNGKKEIGVKIRKQNFQKHILHKIKLESRFVGEKKEHKNTWAKTFGDKHWCKKIETKKSGKKYKEKS